MNTNKLTVRQVIMSFKHLLADKGPISSQNSYSNRELYFLLLRYRARILSEKQRSRGFSLSRYNFQTLGCVPVDSVDFVECPCVPASGCSFLKTKVPIPKPIGGFQSVMTIDGQIQYDFIQWEAFPDLEFSRFKAERTEPYYTLRDVGDGTYIYLYNDVHKEFVTVTGIFEDPLIVHNFPDCDTLKTDDCFIPMDQEFIIDPDLLPLVYDLAIQQLFRVKQQGIDNINDGNDNLTTTPISPK